MTADNWKVNADGDWATASNWSAGLPNSASSVTISTTNVHTITHNSGSDVISKLTVGKDFFVLGGSSSLDVLTTASFADGFTQNSGTLSVAGGMTITGATKLLGGGSENTTFSITGATTLSGYTLGGSSVLNVASTANETGQVTLGDGTDVGAAIKTGAKGVYSIAGDVGITQGGNSATFFNAGTLRKTSGSGASVVGVSLRSTGTLAVASGDLQFTGPTNVITGAVSGAGEISFAGSSVTTIGKATLSVGTLGIFNTATVSLHNSLTFSGVLTDTSNGGSTLNVGATTFTLAGASAAFVGANGAALITGSGTLSNKSVTTLNIVTLGGTLALSNAKTINQSGSVTVGDGGGGAPSITNLSTGIYDFTNDSNLSVNGSTGVFLNQGLLEKTAGAVGQSTTISMAVTNTGTIDAKAGSLAFNGTVVSNGTISGAGTVFVTGPGSMTLNAGTVLSVANFTLLNTAGLTLGASLTYAGVFSDTSNGSNVVNLGTNTLTLTGKNNSIVSVNGVDDITGSGTLANSGTMSLGHAVIDGTTQISNTGTINQNAVVDIGGAGGQAAAITNGKGANYNVTGAFTLENGASAASHFNNAGTVTVQAATGTAVFATTFTNFAAGTINIATGALQISGVLNELGTISGTKLILANNSQTTFSAGSTLSVSEIEMFNTATLTIGASMTYAGTFVDDTNGSNEINLGANTLTLTGVTDFDPINGTDLITGSGTLKLAHATTFGGQTVEIGGTATLSITSKLTASTNLQIGDTSANAAKVVLAASGTYDLTSNAGLVVGNSAASTFTNNGVFEKTAGTGTSVVATKFVNNGTITVTSGTLEFLAGTLSGGGAINGTKTTDMNGNIFITAATPGVVKASAAVVHPSSSAGAANLLVQAAATFGAGRGSAAHWDPATLQSRETHLAAISGHSESRRLN